MLSDRLKSASGQFEMSYNRRTLALAAGTDGRLAVNFSREGETTFSNYSTRMCLARPLHPKRRIKR